MCVYMWHVVSRFCSASFTKMAGMKKDENAGIEGNVFVVTGGLGFVGAALCFDLLRRGARLVRSFDCRASSPWYDELRTRGVLCIQGDITRKEDIEKALEGADCVFHLVSFGMSGKEMLQFDRIYEININGTLNVLEACFKNEVGRLVYISSHNVVFRGNEIKNGDETLPYVSFHDSSEAYGLSKSIAEWLVLKSNTPHFKRKAGKCLYTCAIRPPAIWGPGEERHLPRVMFLAKSGFLLFRLGEPSVLTDWIYVDNLVLALILASKALSKDIPVAAGQSYFVSDGCPVNSFEFIRPLLRSLGYDLPKATIPKSVALLLGKISQAFYVLFHPWLHQTWLPQPPMLLPAEVTKVTVTHYFSISKAKQELGYLPSVTPQEGMATTIMYWQSQKQKSLAGPTISTSLFYLFGVLSLFLAAWFPNVGPVPVLRAISLFFFRSIRMVPLVFVSVVAAHVGEAIYAWFLAKRVDPANANGWFLQTMALGLLSLRFLWKKVKEHEP